MSAPQLFSKKALAWIISTGLISFLLVIAMSIFMDDPRYMGTFGADSYSRSALGHKAFLEALKKSGFNVLQSQNQTQSKVTDNSLLLLLEPQFDPNRAADYKALFRQGTILLVLPKRIGVQSVESRRWVGLTTRVGLGRIETIISNIPGAQIDFEKKDTFYAEEGDNNWNIPAGFFEPEIESPQTLSWWQLTPIISNAQGTLFGKVEGVTPDLYVLTDPDILQTHGLGKGDNAALVFAIINQLGKGRDAIIIDETTHGHLQSPNLLKSAFSAPFLYPVIILICALVVIIWATSGSFAQAQAEARSGFRRDKTPLIRNISKLLEFGGYYGTVTQRYYQEILKDLAEKLHAPAGLEDQALIKWVDERAKARGAKESLKNLTNLLSTSVTGTKTDTARQVRLARKIYQWKEEVINGTGKNKQT